MSPLALSMQKTKKSTLFSLSSPLPCLIAACFAAPAWAQQVPPSLDPGQLLRQEKPKLPGEDISPSMPAIKPAPARPSAKPDVGPLITVNSIKFDGLTVLTDAQAQQLVASAIGKQLSFSALQTLGDSVADALRKQGYFLAQVILPVQDVTAGNITFKVIEGRLRDGDGALSIDGKSRLSATRVEGMLRAPLQRGLLREKDLERGILLVNDLPGTNATVTVQPGAQAETSSLQATLKEMPLLRGNATLDTFGNRYTGSIRAGLNMYLDNPAGFGDQIAATLVKSLDGDSNFARLGYTAPLGYSGLQLGANVSHLNYKVGRDLANLRSDGTADVVSVFARYPLIRSRLSNLYLSAGADSKHLKSDTLGSPATDKDVDLFNIGLNGDAVDDVLGGGIFSGNLTLNEGKLKLDKLPAVLAQDAASFNTNGSFQRVNYGLTRLQTLNRSTVLQISINGQYADRNLDTSEKLSLGGPIGVRAYAAGEALGDRGLIASAEVRTVVAKALRFKGFTLGDVQLSAFYDEGRIQQFVSPTSTVSTPNHYSLSGAGFGLNIGDAGVYDFRLIVARKLGNNPGINPVNGTDSDGDKNLGRVAALLNIYF
jgi:hemolysin activation/secretion protein